MRKIINTYIHTVRKTLQYRRAEVGSQALGNRRKASYEEGGRHG